MIVDTALRRFEAYAERKTRDAAATRIAGFETVLDLAPGRGMAAIGNTGTRGLLDGDFYESADLGSPPRINLVFVQSRDGNTEADNPSELGGGDTDTHLVYEGLSRVDADGVLAGAATAREDDLVFSVWHPDLIRLR